MGKETAVLNGMPGVSAGTGENALQLDLAVSDAKRLVSKHFGAVSRIESFPMRDAETEGSYIEVSFEIRGEVKDVRTAYDRFTDEWVKAYPFEVRELIRFSFSVIQGEVSKSAGRWQCESTLTHVA